MSGTDERAAVPTIPALGVSRLLLVATGSVSSADLPFWCTWLRTCYPEMAVKVVLTRGANRFVTTAGLHGRVPGEVLADEWPDGQGAAAHVLLQDWAEAVIVHPATLHYLARFALGLADCPSLLALQCTSAPIAIAPALPPGGATSHAYLSHRRAVESRDNVALCPPRRGVSVTTGKPDSWAPALLPECVEALEALRLRMARRDAAAEPSEPSGDGSARMSAEEGR
ncbi:flavoprotein [Nocardiopsis aegyptia]|uniref:flavoprotein n=1 Tax=Nocardiopsis aegyptia TaxID=220378 RepID=UPI003671280F